MTGPFFEKNLHALEQRYPHYAQRLRSLSRVEHLPVIEPEEVYSWLRHTMSHPVEQVVMLGTRGGYAVEVLLRDYDLRNLVVIEKDFERFKQVLENVDLSDALQNPHVFWVVGYPADELEDGLLYCKTSLAAIGFQLLQDTPSWRESTHYYVAVLRELKRIMEEESFHLRARMARGQLVQRNLIYNLPVMLASNTPDDVQGLFPKTPAIVVAAGPSLDSNVAELKRVGESAVILAVDTALHTLQKQGVEPHIVVTSDPSQDNTSHFESIAWPSKAALAFSPDIYYTIPEILSQAHPRICLYDDSSRMNFRLRSLLPFRHLIDRPLHVGETAARLALLMGCDPVILVGMDLALPQGYAATHAESSARACKILSRSDVEIEVALPNGKNVTHSLVTVPGVRGEKVQTFYSFQMYIEQIEDLIRNTPVRWIDATEGGALKEGMEIAPLRAVVDQLCTQRYDVISRLQQLPRPLNEYSENCIPFIQEGIQRIEVLSKDLKRIVSGQVEEDESLRIWEEFLTDERIRTLLDHAVFHFQLHPRIKHLPPHKRMEFVLTRANEALGILHLFLPLWRDALARLSTQ